MSFDVAVWHPLEEDFNADSASRFYSDLCARPLQSFVPGVEMAQFLATVEERYRIMHRIAELPWAVAPDISEDCVIMSIQPQLASDVFPIILDLARERGLICFDPQKDMVYQPPGRGLARSFTLELADGRLIDEPGEALIERSVRGLSDTNWFVILERRRDYYLQAGCGVRSEAPSGSYVMEYREGGPNNHWRTYSISLDELSEAFLKYFRGDTDWNREFLWEPVVLG